MKIKPVILIVVLILASGAIYSQDTAPSMMKFMIKYCDNTIDSVYYSIDDVNDKKIENFKKSYSTEIDFIDFHVKGCEPFPPIPKYDKNDKNLEEDSEEFQNYLRQIGDSIALEFLPNDTIKAIVRNSYICCKSFVGQIKYDKDNSIIQLFVSPFGNYCYCSCTYTFEFKFIFTEAENFTIEFKNCEE